MKSLIIIFVIISTSMMAKDPPIFQNSEENTDFLKYFFYSNSFDSAKVTYFFGEVQLENGGNTSNIPLIHALDTMENRFYQSLPQTGICTDLEELSKTENIIIPESGESKIKYYRILSVSGNPCDGYEPDPGGPGDWDISDETQFVIQCRNAKTDNLIAVIDSVVSKPNNDPNQDSISGTSPFLAFREWNVPLENHGDTLYLQVSPRRYGTTPYGMTMKEIPMWANFKCIVDSAGDWIHGQQDYLDSLAWIELQDYLNDYLADNEDLPFHSYYIPHDYRYLYVQNYLSDREIDVINGDTFYVKTYYPDPENFGPTSVDKMTPDNIYKTSIIPNPSNGSNITIKIMSSVNARDKIYLFSKALPERVLLWEGVVKRGENIINVDLSAYPSGSYGIILSDAKHGKSIMHNFTLTK
jgi:hypothetical protein